MNGCQKPEYNKLLHAFELGLLDDVKRKELELHLMDCETCFKELKSFQVETRLIKEDSEIKDHINNLSDSPVEKKSSIFNLRTLTIPLVSAAAIILLILSPWQIDIKPTDEVMALEDKLLIANFENLSEDKHTNEYGKMVSNLLISDLSQTDIIKVVSSERLFDINRILTTASSDSASALEQAQYAQARWLISGALMSVDSVSMVNAQLIKVETGEIIQSFVVESQVDENLFSLVERFSAEIKSYLIPDSNLDISSNDYMAGITTTSEEAYYHYLLGIDNFRKHYYREAMVEFEKVLSYDSTFAMAYYYLSRLKDRSFIDKAVLYSSGVGYSDSVYIISRKLTISGNNDSAMIVLNDMIKKYPNEKYAYYQLGLNSYRHASFDSAIFNLNQVVELDPFYKQAYNVLAYCYAMQDDYDNTIISIDKYIELAKDEANPYDTKGTLHAAFGHLDKAIDAYQQALEIKSDFYSSLSMLSYMYLYKNDFKKFDSCNSILLKSDSKIMVPSARLYETYLPIRQGRFNRAFEIIENNIQTDIVKNVNPIHLVYKYYMKAILFEGLGQLDSALVVMKETAVDIDSITPKNKIGFKHYEIYLLVKMGKVDQAREYVESIANDYENYANGYFTYWFGRGMLEYSENNYELAAEYFEKSVTRSLERNAYGNYGGQYMAALSYYMGDNPAKAADNFEQMKSIYTSDRLFWSIWDIKIPYYLGKIYEQSNWNEKAANEYRDYLKYMEQVDFDSKELDDAKLRLEQLEKIL